MSQSLALVHTTYSFVDLNQPVDSQQTSHRSDEFVIFWFCWRTVRAHSTTQLKSVFKTLSSAHSVIIYARGGRQRNVAVSSPPQRRPPSGARVLMRWGSTFRCVVDDDDGDDARTTAYNIYIHGQLHIWQSNSHNRHAVADVRETATSTTTTTTVLFCHCFQSGCCSNTIFGFRPSQKHHDFRFTVIGLVV